MGSNVGLLGRTRKHEKKEIKEKKIEVNGLEEKKMKGK